MRGFSISKNFLERAFWGSLAAVFTIFAITLSHVPTFSFLFPITLCAVSGIALWEYFQLASLKETRPLVRIGIIASTLYLTLRYFSLFSTRSDIYTEFFIFLYVVTLFLAHFKRPDGSTNSLATTFFGFLYITIPLGLMFDINFGLSAASKETTPIWLYYLIFTTKACDIGAYCVGKQIGKRKITPILSPKKTLEGAIGGVIASVIVSLLFFALVTYFNAKIIPELSLGEYAFLGVLIALAGIVGDLAESLIKRDAKAKDSNDLPGFGGILDMIDSLLFTTPLLYVYLMLKCV